MIEEHKNVWLCQTDLTELIFKHINHWATEEFEVNDDKLDFPLADRKEETFSSYIGHLKDEYELSVGEPMFYLLENKQDREMNNMTILSLFDGDKKELETYSACFYAVGEAKEYLTKHYPDAEEI